MESTRFYGRISSCILPLQQFFEPHTKHYWRDQTQVQVIWVTLLLQYNIRKMILWVGLSWSHSGQTLSHITQTSTNETYTRISTRSKIISFLKRMCSSLSERRSLTGQRGLHFGSLPLMCTGNFFVGFQTSKEQECVEGMKKYQSSFFFFFLFPSSLKCKIG